MTLKGDFCKVHDPTYFCKNENISRVPTIKKSILVERRDNMTAEWHVLVNSYSPCICNKLPVLFTVVVCARCHIPCKHCSSVYSSSVLSQHGTFPEWVPTYKGKKIITITD